MLKKVQKILKNTQSSLFLENIFVNVAFLRSGKVFYSSGCGEKDTSVNAVGLSLVISLYKLCFAFGINGDGRAHYLSVSVKGLKRYLKSLAFSFGYVRFDTCAGLRE